MNQQPHGVAQEDIIAIKKETPSRRPQCVSRCYFFALQI